LALKNICDPNIFVTQPNFVIQNFCDPLKNLVMHQARLIRLGPGIWHAQRRSVGGALDSTMTRPKLFGVLGGIHGNEQVSRRWVVT
jgi:hypothetical protein